MSFQIELEAEPIGNLYNPAVAPGERPPRALDRDYEQKDVERIFKAAAAASSPLFNRDLAEHSFNFYTVYVEGACGPAAIARREGAGSSPVAGNRALSTIEDDGVAAAPVILNKSATMGIGPLFKKINRIIECGGASLLDESKHDEHKWCKVVRLAEQTLLIKVGPPQLNECQMTCLRAADTGAVRLRSH